VKRQRDYDGIEENKENIGRERKLVIMEHHKIDINKTKVEGICLYGGGGRLEFGQDFLRLIKVVGYV
jgi:hypothetical protein